MKIAVNMVKEGLIDKRLRFPVLILMNLTSCYTRLLTLRRRKMLSPWGFQHRRARLTGKVVFNAEDAEKSAEKKEKVILVRKETRLKILAECMYPRVS